MGLDKLKAYQVDWTPIGVFKAISYYLAISFSTTMDYIEVRKEIAVALALAMIFDTITGMMKSKALGIPITSRAGKKGVYEKILTLIGVILLGVIAKLMGVDLSWLVTSTLILLTIFEVYSFFGNIGSIKSGREIEELDAVSSIIKFVRKSLLGFLVNHLGVDPDTKKRNKK